MQLMKRAVASMNSKSCDWAVAAALPSEDLLGLILHCTAISSPNRIASMLLHHPFPFLLTVTSFTQVFHLSLLLLLSYKLQPPNASKQIEPCHWPPQRAVLWTLVWGNTVTFLQICCVLCVVLAVCCGQDLNQSTVAVPGDLVCGHIGLVCSCSEILCLFPSAFPV